MNSKIVYILSFPRSGSTLLGNLLAAGPGAIHVGEFDRMWVRNTKVTDATKRTCGCGRLVGECEIWSQVLKRVGDDLDMSHDDLVGVLNGTNFGPPRWGSGHREYPEIDDELRSVIRRFYPVIADVSQSEFIIDSSKSIGYLGLLRQEYGEENLRVVHLIRDARGVVASRSRNLEKKWGYGKVRSMPYMIRDALDWRRFNAVSESMFGDMPHYTQMSYTDLTADVEATLQATIPGIGVQPEITDGNVVDLPPNHTVNGNRIRGESGPTEIREDLRWRDELNAALRLAVRLAAGPMP